MNPCPTKPSPITPSARIPATAGLRLNCGAAAPGLTSRPVRLIMSQAASRDPPAKGIGTMADAPRVFLSYSHDSDEHADRVLALADALCDGGIDVILDRYVHPAPEEGWPRWMERNLDAAEFVLMVCTETYRRRVMGEEEPGQGTRRALGREADLQPHLPTTSPAARGSSRSCSPARSPRTSRPRPGAYPLPDRDLRPHRPGLSRPCTAT